METLNEKQLMAVLLSGSSEAVNSLIRAVDDILSGQDPDEMIKEVMDELSALFSSKKFAKVVEVIGASARQLDGRFSWLHEVLQDFMPEPEQV